MQSMKGATSETVDTTRLEVVADPRQKYSAL